METLTSMPASYPKTEWKPLPYSEAEIDKACQLNATQVRACPNEHRHISSEPGYGRVLCFCGKAYLRVGK